jgi:site-specific DNA recombinase
MSRLKEAASRSADAGKYAAIYVRVSTEDQGKGFSIPTQIEACHTFARQHSYIVPEGYVLIDDGISGTILERPGLQKLRELVRARAIQAVIVFDLDRLSRRLGHQLLLSEECEQAEVALVVVSSPIEANPEGALMLHMKGALAEYERAKTLERTRRGRLGRAKAGHPHGGRVPFDYRYVSEPHKGHYEVDEAEAEIVRRIFTMCLSGLTVRSIAKQLTLERVPTAMDRGPRGGGNSKKDGHGLWAQSAVHRILRNTAYIGTTYFDKCRVVHREILITTEVRKTRETRQHRPPDEWIPIAVPPIMDEATFGAAQTQLVRNTALALRNTHPHRTYLLRGRWFRCRRCGRAMFGRIARAGQKSYSYYQCSSLVAKLLAEQRCRGSIRADEADARVWTTVMSVLEQPERIAEEVAKRQATSDDRQAAIEQEQRALESALARCDREEQRWAEAYASEVISLEELKTYRADIGRRRRDLQAHFEDLETRRQIVQQAVAQVAMLVEYCGRVREQLQTFSVAEKQQVFDALALQVRWTPGEPLRIEVSIPLDTIAPTPPACYAS